MAEPDPIARPLGAWIHRQAEVRPDSAALSFGGATLTFAAFADRIDRLTFGLHRRLQLQVGERIAYLGHNHADLLTLMFAAARLGLIVAPLNWRLAPPEHQTILADAAPKALLVQEPFADEAENLLREGAAWRPIALDFSHGGWFSFDDLLDGSGEVAAVGGGEHPLQLVYTSGTTGLAKGAVLTQDALCWNAANSVDMHGLTHEDRVLTTLPLFHVGGLNIQTLPALAVGAEVLLQARFDPASFLEIIACRRVTLTVLVPAIMKALIDHPAFATADLSSLRQIATGSSIVPTSLIQPFLDHGIPVTQVYGTTETAPIAVYQRKEDAAHTLGSTGKTARHGEMRLVDDDGRPLAAGASGHIQIRGPQVMTGYWNNPEATAGAFDGAWFRTGDIGRLDEGGSLWVEGRADDLIKSGSERIYPAEIEDLLRMDSDVEDVVVVGRADPAWGEVPVAVVQLAEGAVRDPDRLLQRLDGRIARFKWPKEVCFVDALPRSALGKILRYVLRAEIEKS
ncbi:MAG: AMP-binding protein [Alphaproteobacteria bacterium]